VRPRRSNDKVCLLLMGWRHEPDLAAGVIMLMALDS